MVANRVARGRERANQILALNPARRHHFPPPRRHRQIALAYRARLSRAQAGGGARPLRRTWVARLPPPRDAMHRSLRFLISERGAIPPSGPRRAWPFPPSALSDGYRPRGSAPASRTAHSEFNRNRAPATDRSSRQQTAAMSMLRSSNREKHAPENFLMQ